jgi:tetratricopeptide (TPR) repeat protein
MPLKKPRLLQFLPGAVILVLAGLACWLWLPGNLANLGLLKDLFEGDSSSLVEAQQALSNQNNDCRAKLKRAVIESQLNGLEKARPAWESLLSCPVEYSSFLKAEFPKDLSMAQKILAAFPAVASNYFWLAGLLPSSETSQIMTLLRQGIQYDPYNGPAWCSLGYAQRRQRDLPSAADSFSTCCQLGAPGDQGCLAAGNIYKSLGDLSKAVQNYLSSHDPAVIELGNALQKQISEGN